MKIQIENLKAQMQGEKLNLHQRADALIEFNKLVEYVEGLKTDNEIEKEEIVKRYETFVKADTTPVFLKEAVFKCMEEYAEYIAPKCECRKEWLSHRREYDQHLYGDNIEYDECEKCGEKHNFHCF